jgi:hypothetical protein
VELVMLMCVCVDLAGGKGKCNQIMCNAPLCRRRVLPPPHNTDMRGVA